MSQFESGFRTILGAKLTAAATSMTVATIPTVTAGRLYLNNGAQEEWISFTGRSGTTITGLTRGLSKTAVPATAGTGLSWIAGTPVILVEMHDQMPSLAGDNTWTGINEFTGTMNFTNVGDLNVNGKSNPTPVVATTIARDALYTSPVTGDMIYVESLNAEQIYNGGTHQRETLAVGTPAPDATNDIKGIDYKNVETQLVDNTYMLGEAIIAGQCVFVESGPATGAATTKQDVSRVTANTRVSFPVIGTGVASATFKVNICKTGAPSENLNFRIETDNAGNPTGTLASANCTATVTAADLTTSLADTTVSLSGTGVANAHGVTLDLTEAGETLYKGVKFTLTTQTSMLTVTKDGDCNATTAYLYSITGVLLASAIFSSQIATFNYDSLVSGQSYYIATGSDGGIYTSVKQTGATVYPYISTQLNFMAGAEVGGSTTTEGHGLTFNASGTTGASVGVRIKALRDIYVESVNIKTGGTATTCYLRSDAGTILDTVSIVSDVATLTTPYKFTTGTYFRLEVCNGGSNFTTNYVNSDPIVTKTNIEFVSGSTYGGDNIYYYDIESVVTNTGVLIDDTNIYNITTITTRDNAILTLGAKYHVVLFQGTYGSETVSNTNYYDIGYSTNDTSTRGTKLFDGSAYGDYLPAEWCYASSGLFKDRLLSLTDSDFSYKIDLYGISIETEGIGTYPRLTVEGINNNQTGLTENSIYYLGATPGGIDTSAGTNICQVGKAINATKLTIDKKMQTITITPTASPMTWTNTLGRAVQVKITGGTVNPVVNDGITIATATSLITTVAPGKALVITYSSAPTIVYSDI